MHSKWNAHKTASIETGILKMHETSLDKQTPF